MVCNSSGLGSSALQQGLVSTLVFTFRVEFGQQSLPVLDTLLHEVLNDAF
jgi:hypothetical protein